MTRITLALALLAAPIQALAQQPRCDHHEAATCAEGTTWDTVKAACVPIVSS